MGKKFNLFQYLLIGSIPNIVFSLSEHALVYEFIKSELIVLLVLFILAPLCYKVFYKGE